MKTRASKGRRSGGVTRKKKSPKPVRSLAKRRQVERGGKALKSKRAPSKDKGGHSVRLKTAGARSRRGTGRLVSEVSGSKVVAQAPGITKSLDKQQQHYEEGVRLFHAKIFDRAGSFFQRATQGPNRTLAHHAQVHFQICQKRMQPQEVKLTTAEDHYNYAVTLINARRLKEAAEHLELALRMAPKGDHLHYALAATQALQGNPQAAYEKLRAAIELRPQNRILARSDPDFSGILDYPPIALLLQLDRRSSVRNPIVAL